MWVIGFPEQTLVPLKFTENCLCILSGTLTSLEVIKPKRLFPLVRFEILFSMCRTWPLCPTQVIWVDGSSAIVCTVCVTLTSSQPVVNRWGWQNRIAAKKSSSAHEWEVGHTACVIHQEEVSQMAYQRQKGLQNATCGSQVRACFQFLAVSILLWGSNGVCDSL